jgi:hypothetical protein
MSDIFKWATTAPFHTRSYMLFTSLLIETTGPLTLKIYPEDGRKNFLRRIGARVSKLHGVTSQRTVKFLLWIGGYQDGDYDDCYLLGSDVVWSGRRSPTFRGKEVPLYSNRRVS